MHGQVVFLKARRISELVIFVVSLIIIYTAFTYWVSGTRQQFQRNSNVFHNSYLREQIFKQRSRGQTDLAKYIHLDLKGAPPRAKQFYEPFFHFLDELQMGVKGVVIEYEDMLPLQGNLINVSVPVTRR